jgi:hypothetical protein
MKTNRRWLNSVIVAAASEQVSLPWAARRTNTRSALVAAHSAQAAAKTQGPVAPAQRPYTYAIAAR